MKAENPSPHISCIYSGLIWDDPLTLVLTTILHYIFLSTFLFSWLFNSLLLSFLIILLSSSFSSLSAFLLLLCPSLLNHLFPPFSLTPSLSLFSLLYFLLFASLLIHFFTLFLLFLDFHLHSLLSFNFPSHSSLFFAFLTLNFPTHSLLSFLLFTSLTSLLLCTFSPRIHFFPPVLLNLYVTLYSLLPLPFLITLPFYHLAIPFLSSVPHSPPYSVFPPPIPP